MFLTADDSFAYAFTDFAASGLPIQILQLTRAPGSSTSPRSTGSIHQDRRGPLAAAYKSMAPKYADTESG